MKRIVAILIAVFMVAIGLTTLPPAQQAQAAPPGSAFDPGYIISDSVFYDFGSMTVEDIQDFLDSKVTDCRATDPAIDCLKNIKVDIPETPATGPDEVGPCSAIPAMPQASAAQVIHAVANSCGINPKVLIVTLQKEQGLVASTKPTEYMYRAAMGFGCPDSDPAICGKVYVGLFNQLYRAAKQLQWYGDPAGSFTYWKPGRTVSMRYNPKSSCGTKSFELKNQATAALYYYTPYTPNDAALNNMYGTGDSCSAYGNRNFWRFYHDWFGSPVAGGYLVQASAESGIFLITDRNRYEITDTRLIAAFEPMGPVGTVSQPYLDSFENAGPATQMVRNPAGETFFVSQGTRYQVLDCEIARHFGTSCDASINLGDWQVRLLADGGVLDQVFQNSSGAIFWASEGRVSLLLDDRKASPDFVLPDSPIRLDPESLITVEMHEPLVTDGVAFRIAETSNYAVAIGGKYYFMPANLAADLPMRTWFRIVKIPVPLAEIEDSLKGTSNVGIVRLVDGPSYLLTSNGKYVLEADSLWGQAGVAWPSTLLDRIPDAGSLDDAAVLTMGNSYTYFASSGKRRTVVNLAAAKSLMSLIGQKRIVAVPKSAMLALEHVGSAMAPGMIVKETGTANVYLSDGLGSLVPIKSSALVRELKAPSISLSKGAVAKLQIKTPLLGNKIECGGQLYLLSRGELSAMSSQVAAHFTPEAYSLQASTCFAIGESETSVGRILKDSLGRHWALAGGKRWLLSPDHHIDLIGETPEPMLVSKLVFSQIRSGGNAATDFEFAGAFSPATSSGFVLNFEEEQVSKPSSATKPDSGSNQSESSTTATYYTVKAGDTLNSISGRFNVSVEKIMKLNGLDNPNRIYVGQRLLISEAASDSTDSEPAAPVEPEPTPVEPEPEPPQQEPNPQNVKYTVQSGDTLLSIARKFGVTSAQIISANGLTNPDRIRVGQVLLIPTFDTAGAVEVAPEPSVEPEVTYTVQQGDTLWGIARKFGVSSSALAELNGITNANFIRVGQVLKIPS